MFDEYERDDLRTRIAAAVIPEIPLLMLVVGAVVIWWRS